MGHHFVDRLRGEFIKRILDSRLERIEQIGSPHLLVALTCDVQNIILAFVRLPELREGKLSELAGQERKAVTRDVVKRMDGAT